MTTPEPMLLQLTNPDESEFSRAARRILDFAGEHKILAFFGEMGAGKTTLIRFICRELGVSGTVSSPTFSIVNEYRAQGGRSVYHFDFYRIKKEAEAVEIGLEEYFESGAICLVEWPEKILNLLPHPRVRVDIRVEQETRLITLSYE